MIWLLRFVLLFVIISLIYFTIQYFLTPQRKLETARKHKRFLLLDHEDAVKNFHLTFHGAVFTGEKYLGTTKNSMDVVSISLWPENTACLKGMIREDFQYIEKMLLEKYPSAQIHWKSPIHEFLQQK